MEERPEPREPLLGAAAAPADLDQQRGGGEAAGRRPAVIDSGGQTLGLVPLAHGVVGDAAQYAGVGAEPAPAQAAALGQRHRLVKGGAGGSQVADVVGERAEAVLGAQLHSWVASGGRAAAGVV